MAEPEVWWKVGETKIWTFLIQEVANRFFPFFLKPEYTLFFFTFKQECTNSIKKKLRGRGPCPLFLYHFPDDEHILSWFLQAPPARRTEFWSWLIEEKWAISNTRFSKKHTAPLTFSRREKIIIHQLFPNFTDVHFDTMIHTAPFFQLTIIDMTGFTLVTNNRRRREWFVDCQNSFFVLL